VIRVFLVLIFLTVIIAAILNLNVWIALIGLLVVLGGLPYATRVAPDAESSEQVARLETLADLHQLGLIDEDELEAK
jgi:acetate kinase